MSVACAGSSKIVAGTLLGAWTSSRRLVSHAVSARITAAPKMASVIAGPPRDSRTCLVRFIGIISVVEAKAEEERRELRILGLIERNRARLATEAVLGIDARVPRPGSKVAAAHRERHRLRTDKARI